MRHTPTPWRVERHYSGHRTVAQMRSCDRVVCINATTDAEPVGYDATDANAEFIVRACNSHEELLEAAKQAQCGCSIAERESGHRVECWMPALLDAIAKAEGR